MAWNYQIETSTDRYLLEDGSGVLILEVQPVASKFTARTLGGAIQVFLLLIVPAVLSGWR